MNWKKVLLVNLPREGEGVVSGGEAAPVEPVVAPVETPTPAPEPEVKTPAWVLPRIGELTAKLRDSERKAQELEAKFAAQQAPTPSPEATPDFKAAVTAEARRVLYDTECNKVWAKGNAEFPDFAVAVQTLNHALGGLSSDFVEAAIETGDAPRVLYELSKDINKAAGIMLLGTPAKIAVAVTKYAESLAKPQAAPKRSVSGVPEPIPGAVGGTVAAQPSLENEGLSMKEWIAQREKDLKAKRGR